MAIQISKELKSEVELNNNIIEVSDLITYSDNSNFMQYKVTELFEGGMEVKAMNDNCNVEIGKLEDLYFNELQIGWKFSDETRILKKQLDAN